MKCVVCRNGETRTGRVTVTLEREGLILVVKGVPGRACENCGEEHLEEAETARLLGAADGAARAGIRVEVREYEAA
jgi:YgiT-type zinc finger domain-containing protein